MRPADAYLHWIRTRQNDRTALCAMETIPVRMRRDVSHHSSARVKARREPRMNGVGACLHWSRTRQRDRTAFNAMDAIRRPEEPRNGNDFVGTVHRVTLNGSPRLARASRPSNPALRTLRVASPHAPAGTDSNERPSSPSRSVDSRQCSFFNVARGLPAGTSPLRQCGHEDYAAAKRSRDGDPEYRTPAFAADSNARQQSDNALTFVRQSVHCSSRGHSLGCACAAIGRHQIGAASFGQDA